MSGTTFDALSATRTLRDAGFEDRQAEAVAGVVRHAVAVDRSTLATKADLHAGLAEVKAEISRVEAKLEAKLDAHTSSARWVFGLVVALQFPMAARMFGAL